MGHSYILSICMMVKNEEKNLGRCLTGLKPLLEKSDVELIIVDTGSTDKTIEIASSYTSKLYFHEWTNQFSYMRNITISYARGKYILILDADEVLQNPLLLYEYLADKRFQSFNTYVLKIKNFDSNGSYTVLPQERIFRNDGEFRYAGAVHNQPQYKTPVVNTDIYIDHYGYLYNDKELKERKFKRTGDILKEELKKDPDNPYYRYQLARSYNAHGDREEALDQIRIAYRLITGSKEKRKLYSYIYSAYAMICCEMNEFREAADVCREGIEAQPEYVDLYYLFAFSANRLDMKYDAVDYYKRYLDLAVRYDSLAVSSSRALEMFYLGESFQDTATSFVADELYKQCKYDEALKYVGLIHDKKIKTTLLVKVLLKLKMYDELKSEYIEEKDNAVKDLFINILEAERSNLNAERKIEVERIFSSGEDIYSLLNQMRLNIFEAGDDSRILDMAVKLADFNSLPEYYAEMFAGIDHNTRKIMSIFKRLNKTKIKQYINEIIEKREDLKDFLETYLETENIREDFQALKLYIGIAYVILLSEAISLNKSKGEIPDKYIGIFKQYITNGFKYISLLYNTERLRMNYNCFEDQEDRFFAAISFATESASKGDNKTGIRYFLEAAKANRYLAVYMNKFKEELFPAEEVTIGGVDENG